ncbi:hypothetical protein ACN4EK_16470 [Pantanalinema rosaneae CENA516]|uniref:hypothetical protein n=1 Tax=Pantanalinema rosaneae TaxID=1620701 RepID=UPI003D6DAF8D
MGDYPEAATIVLGLRSRQSDIAFIPPASYKQTSSGISVALRVRYHQTMCKPDYI